jgi:hypothetical protein
VGFRPNVTMRFDHPATTKAMVPTGLGISLLPIWTVAEDVAAGRLTRIEQREPPLLARMVTRAAAGELHAAGGRRVHAAGRRVALTRRAAGVAGLTTRPPCSTTAENPSGAAPSWVTSSRGASCSVDRRVPNRRLTRKT